MAYEYLHAENTLQVHWWVQKNPRYSQFKIRLCKKNVLGTEETAALL